MRAVVLSAAGAGGAGRSGTGSGLATGHGAHDGRDARRPRQRWPGPHAGV